MAKPFPGYENEYCKAAKKLNVWYYSRGRKYRGHMNGLSPKEIVELCGKIQNCTCGSGNYKMIQCQCGMGEFDVTIICQSCGRRINRSLYDDDVKEVHHLQMDSKHPMEEFCVRDWNNGLNQEDIKESVLTQYLESDLYKEMQGHLKVTKTSGKRNLLKRLLWWKKW